MKSTGIVRQVDNLGRVVIPKEIRRTMRIREKDPLEIFTGDAGEIIFKKYSPIADLSEFAGQYAAALQKTTGFPVLVCDQDHVIAAAGIPKKEMLSRRISSDLENVMGQGEFYICQADDRCGLQPVEGMGYHTVMAAPILASGNRLCGAILFVDTANGKAMGEVEMKLLITAATFLGIQMEE